MLEISQKGAYFRVGTCEFEAREDLDLRRTLIEELGLIELFVNHAIESYLRETGKLKKCIVEKKLSNFYLRKQNFNSLIYSLVIK